MIPAFQNPFRPGAGHMPPYLAGRDKEQKDFVKHIHQQTILQNIIVTGLRGAGKTVLMSSFQPLAIGEGWLWSGTDLSESASISELNLCTRIITDLSAVTSTITITETSQNKTGFIPGEQKTQFPLNNTKLASIFEKTPGLLSDKLKATLLYAWHFLAQVKAKGVVFSYDEAQNLTDHASKGQFPLSILLDVFQSVQRQGVPFILLLTGLPTIFSRLVDTRTFSERMFHTIEIGRLSRDSSRAAIIKPIENANCPVRFLPDAVEKIIDRSGGYPFFIQFLCREAYDIYIQLQQQGQKPSVAIEALLRKLDTDFFAARWEGLTDRQRDMLGIISRVEGCEDEFTVQKIVAESYGDMQKPFSASSVNQMLNSLIGKGFIYKNRHGRYMFAVPLLDKFIRRQMSDDQFEIPW